jgi:hypothetical protein
MRDAAPESNDTGGNVASQDSSIDSYGALRELSHERHYTLWQVAKQGAAFEGEDARLVQAMREHPEYYDTWEHLTEFGREKVEINGVNPLLHVMMHTVVENQAAQNDPPEVHTIIEFRTAHHIARHETIHAIANVLTDLIWKSLSKGKLFDNDIYRRKLVKMLPRSQRNKPSNHLTIGLDD